MVLLLLVVGCFGMYGVRAEYETVALPVHERSFIIVLEDEEEKEEEELLCAHPHRGSILFTLSSWPRAVV